MSDWPPEWEKCFDHGPDRPVVDAYFLQVHLELETKAAYFDQLSDEQQATLARIVYTLDSFASAAVKELRGSPWRADELRTLNPPASAKSGRQIKRWHHDQANQVCLDACTHARQAIIEGNWIMAVEFAMTAGNRAIGALANSAFRNLKPLLSKESRARQHGKKAQRNQRICAEARKIRKRRPALSVAAIANTIKERSAGKGLSVESIRKIIKSDAKAGKAGPA